MGAPPGHMFQPGFGLGARLANFAYKGAVFAFIGACAGCLGVPRPDCLTRPLTSTHFASPPAPQAWARAWWAPPSSRPAAATTPAPSRLSFNPAPPPAGMCAGVVGTATSNGLLALRKRMDPGYSSPVRGSGRVHSGQRPACRCRCGCCWRSCWLQAAAALGLRVHLAALGGHATRPTHPHPGPPRSTRPRPAPARTSRRPSWATPGAGPFTWASPPTSAIKCSTDWTW